MKENQLTNNMNKKRGSSSERGGMPKGHKHKEESKAKISESMKGNNNGENNDIGFEFMKTQLRTAILLSEETMEKDGVEKYKYDFIGEIFTKLNTYIDQVHKRIKNKDVDGELEELYNELKRRMEQNCYYNTKNNFINTAIGIVNLKSNHKWTDRRDMTSGDKPIESNNEEIKNVLEDIKKQLNK